MTINSSDCVKFKRQTDAEATQKLILDRRSFLRFLDEVSARKKCAGPTFLKFKKTIFCSKNPKKFQKPKYRYFC